MEVRSGEIVRLMVLHDFLHRSAEQFPAKTAIICEGRRVTYAELEASSNQLARSLLGRGLKRGDRVGVFLDNSIESAVSIFGILKAGAAFVVINPQTKTDKLAYMLNNCAAKGLITHTKYLRMAEKSAATVPSLGSVLVSGLSVGDSDDRFLSLEATLEAEQDGPLEVRCIDMDLAAIIYTSGTTGLPKGVTMTHLNMVSASTSITTYIGNVPDDIVINVLPLSFDYGLYQLLMCTQVGMTLVLEKSFAYPYRVVERVEQERVTGFPGVPTVFAMLLQLSDIRERDFSSVRYVTNTAAALPPQHIMELKELFPTARIFSMYGVTESKRCTYMPPEELDARPSSVGKAIPNEEVWIVKEDGSLAAPGEVGELVVRGSNVMQGYWNMPDETAEVLRPGKYPWEKVLYTGDLFKMDEEGYLYFVSRKDDIIKSRGEKVSPKEVETAIYDLDGVAEVAVVGVDDELLGQAIKAYVVLREGAEIAEKDVIAWCRARLEAFMVPKYVEFVDDLPKTASGKVSRTRLSVSGPKSNE